MLNGWVIGTAFIGSLAGGWIMAAANKWNLPRLEPVALWLSFLCGLYCVFAGIALEADWVDPFSTAAPSDLAKASATHGGKGGLIILIIRIWPYFLIGLGGYIVYLSGTGLLRRYQRT